MLTKIAGPKTDEVREKLGRIREEEVHDEYSSPSTIRVFNSRRMRHAGMENGDEYRIAVVKSDKNRPLGKPTSRWEENNKMDLRQIGQGRGLD